MLRKLVAGNWKMNGNRAALVELDEIAKAAKAADGVDVAICPPFTLIEAAATRVPDLTIGGQDCHAADQGAHTGCVSAEMLREAGARLVIVGHSERRADQNESNAEVKKKAEAAIRHGLTAVICVGETEAERDAGQALEVVGAQLDGSLADGATGDTVVIAYEPVWAIGTGRTPSVEDVAEVHAFIRTRLKKLLGDEGAKLRILYGGSVKGDNASELLAVADVDGALVGGASLTAAQFVPIITAAVALSRLAA